MKCNFCYTILKTKYKQTTRKGDQNMRNSYSSIFKIIFLLLFFVTINFSCSKTDSPSQVIQKCNKAFDEGNINKIKLYYSKESLEYAKLTLGNIDSFIERKVIERKKLGGTKNIKIINEEIYGDRAIIKYKILFKNGKEEEEEISLVKEGNVWKINAF